MKVWLVLFTLLILTVTTVASVPELTEHGNSSDRRWKKVTIPVAFSQSLLKTSPAVRPDSDIAGAIRRSLEAWEAVANIEFQVTWTDKLSVSPAGNTGDGTNLVTIAQTPENLLVFGGESEEISARTRVFFNRRGEISEADIVLNPYQQFSTDGSLGTFDFESTLTHEIGHLLGLEHSLVTGATMNEHQGKNGVFNLSGFAPRTLSEDDVTQIRAIYGSRDDADCCGALDGKISLPAKPARALPVWLEDAETGRVVVSSKTGPDGGFTFRGLRGGKYRIYAQDATGAFAGQNLDEIEIFKGRTASFMKRMTQVGKDFDVQFTGFNGQLSNLAIPINGGKSYLIYVGGKNLDPEDFEIGTTSPFFRIDGGNFTRYDYGHEISVFSFEVTVAPETPLGEYTVFLKKSDGQVEFLPGVLTIEKFVNSWNTITFE